MHRVCAGWVNRVYKDAQKYYWSLRENASVPFQDLALASFPGQLTLYAAVARAIYIQQRV